MTLFLVGLVIVLASFVAALFLRGSVPPPEPVEVPPPAPVAVAPAPTHAPAVEPVVIRWVGPHGHVYGQTTMDKRSRRPQMKHVVGQHRAAVFLASHREPDGIWIYREVDR